MQLRDLYNRICSLQSYLPTKEVNSLFSQLVNFALDDTMTHDLSDQEIFHLQNICSQAESEMERYWAEELIAGTKNLSDFWYYSNYSRLTKLEFFALKGCSHHADHYKGCFIGSGPLPLTAMFLASEYGQTIDCYDNSSEAIHLSQGVLQTLKYDNIRLFNSSGESVADFSLYEYIYVAALAGAKDEEKMTIISHIKKTARPGTHIVLRSAYGNRTLLYKPLSPEIEKHLSPIAVIQPRNDIVNSIHIYSFK